MANLTQSQYAQLKTFINAETNPTFVGYRNAGSTGQMAEWLNLYPAADYMLWNTRTKVSEILDSISWDKYTPTDVADNTATFTNRILSVQTKQMNLQNMLIGRDSIDASKANIRAGLRDAVIQLPTGASGAATTAGGANGATVLTACTRKATNGEKYFATVSATNGTVSAFLPVVEGKFSNEDVVNALNQ